MRGALGRLQVHDSESMMTGRPNVTDEPTWVFVSYAKEDRAAAATLYERLRKDGLRPWLDEHDLLPGLDWDRHIRRAIREARFFLVLVSSRSVTKRGYVNKEIAEALDVAEALPEGAVYVIPVRLEDVPVPERLAKWQWIDLFDLDRGAYRRLRASLVRHLGSDYAGPLAEPARRKRTAAPSFKNPADVLIYASAESARSFRWCTLENGKRAVTNNYWMQIRDTIPRSFDSLKGRCAQYGPLDAARAESLLNRAAKRVDEKSRVRTVRMHGSAIYELISDAGISCYVDKRFMNIAFEMYQEGEVLVSGPVDPILVRLKGEAVFVVMPIRMDPEDLVDA